MLTGFLVRSTVSGPTGLKKDVIPIVGEQPAMLGTRGRGPQLVWRSILGKDGQPRYPEHRAIKWLFNQLHSYIHCRRSDANSSSTVRLGLILQQPPEGISGHCGDYSELFASVAQEVSRSISSGDAEPLGALYAQVHEAVQAANLKFQARSRADWKSWLHQGIDRGCKRVHAIIKDPSPWVPSSTLSRDGCVVSDPLSLLKAEGIRFSNIWGAGGGAVPDGRLSAPLPRLKADDIRTISKSYKEASAVSVDGFHCRHYSLLSDQALDCLGAVFSLIEALGCLPPRFLWCCWLSSRNRLAATGRLGCSAPGSGFGDDAVVPLP